MSSQGVNHHRSPVPPPRRRRAQASHRLDGVAGKPRARRRLGSVATGLLILVAATAALAGLLRPSLRPAAAALTGVMPATLHGRSPRAALAGSAKSPTPDPGGIEQRLIADLAGQQGVYGVAVVDLASGLTYGVNGNSGFRAASVNKLPILFTLYEAAAEGRVNLDQQLALSESDIQHYGTGTIQDPDAPRIYTLRQLGTLLIQVSDNTAAYVLERFLGQRTVQASIARWRLDHTSMADNITTPADAASLMANLYADRLLPSDTTEGILTLLQSSVFTDRIASGVPPDVPVAHKVGTDVGVYNDAGIVLLDGRPYAIAILSQDADETEASAAFARVSRDIYSFQSSLAAVRSR